MTAIDRAEDVPKKDYGKGEGVYIDDTMSKPRIINFPYLRFIDKIERLDDLITGDEENGNVRESNY